MSEGDRKTPATPVFTQNQLEEGEEQVEQLTRDRIGLETLERYSGSRADEFQPYVLLTNFKAYLDIFSKMGGVPMHQGSVMRAVHDPARRISMIDHSVGSPMAALVIELLSFLEPKAVLMLGMCGGLREEYRVGDFFNPVAAIREEGTSQAYLPPVSLPELIRDPAASGAGVRKTPDPPPHRGHSHDERPVLGIQRGLQGHAGQGTGPSH